MLFICYLKTNLANSRLEIQTVLSVVSVNTTGWDSKITKNILRRIDVEILISRASSASLALHVHLSFIPMLFYE